MKSAIQVSKLFLAWASENGDIITNLKLQKLLYYAQAWHLVNYGKRLFEEPIEAWVFGPVVSTVYQKWKKYGSNPIPYKATGREGKIFYPQQLEFLKEFYRIFSSFSATALVSMCHNEAPWKDAHQQGSNAIISPAAMKEHYTKLYNSKYGKAR